MLEVKFYDTVDDDLLKFAVIISQSNGKWVMCKHKERDTYEVPGGHREEGEDILETAKRELQEETGAVKFDIEQLCVYSVTGKNSVNETGEESFGLLCFAEIKEFSGELHCEMEKVVLMDELPENWTYPLIQPILLEKFWQMEKQTSVYKGYKQDKIEMRGDRAEMSDFPLYLNTVAGGLDCRDQTIGGFSFVVKIYALPVVEIIG